MRTITILFAALAALLSGPALAELPVGSKAPPFVAATAQAGKAGRFSLAAALKRGPVVVYFYPKAFTPGCTLEARAFAEAQADFAAAGASVVGMSADDLGTLKRFSVEECRGKFPVGVATPAIITAYDVALGNSGMTNRTSYVIGQDGRIAFAYTDRDYREHVTKSLAAVRALSKPKR
jgi:thioredoxin-dependent peroxiredoxin